MGITPPDSQPHSLGSWVCTGGLVEDHIATAVLLPWVVIGKAPTVRVGFLYHLITGLSTLFSYRLHPFI